MLGEAHYTATHTLDWRRGEGEEGEAGREEEEEGRRMRGGEEDWEQTYPGFVFWPSPVENVLDHVVTILVLNTSL